MGYLNEYLDKRMSPQDLMNELVNLMRRYNTLTGHYIFLYVAAMNKASIPDISMRQEDMYVIRDLLNDVKEEKIDVYIETPGGNGNTAEEIGRFLHDKFQEVDFVISGEAKSAGTILALSGNEIYMTETGSLGPIDAQVRIGRSTVSAYDYIDWLREKMNEATKNGSLNPVDATIIAQINPGEIQDIYHSLEFAKDLVQQWLPKYKFRDWNITENQRKPVTEEMKAKRARQIAGDLANHSKWRSHGRSLKITDLNSIGLKVRNLEEEPEKADLIYRIQFVCKLLFETTTTYKIFADEKQKIIRSVVNANINTRNLEVVKPETIKSANKEEIAAKFITVVKRDMREFFNKYQAVLDIRTDDSGAKDDEENR